MLEELFPTSVPASQILTIGNPGTMFYICDVLQMGPTFKFIAGYRQWLWCLFYFLFILATSSEITITCVFLITRGTILFPPITLYITRRRKGRFRDYVRI